MAQGLDFETILRKKFEEDDQKEQEHSHEVFDGEENKEEWTIEDLNQTPQVHSFISNKFFNILFIGSIFLE